MRVAIDGPEGRILATTRAVFVGNNRYILTGLSLGSRERLDQGVLSLFIAPPMTRGRFAAAGFAALFGRMPRSNELHAMTVTSALVHTPQQRPRVALDGEVCRIRAPLRYRIRPSALKVLAP
jgi:diacylglycerol kinase family enzyme